MGQGRDRKWVLMKTNAYTSFYCGASLSERSAIFLTRNWYYTAYKILKNNVSAKFDQSGYNFKPIKIGTLPLLPTVT